MREVDGPMVDGKRRLIRGEGFASQVSGNVRPQDPGGGAMLIVAPRRMMTNDVSNTPGLSGGGAQLVPSRISVVLVEDTNDGDTSGWECLCEDQEMRPVAGTRKPSSGTVSDDDIRSSCGGGGGLPSSVVAGGLLPVDVTDTPTLYVEGLLSVPSRISVVLVDGRWLGTLQDGSVHMRMGICDRRLA